MRWSSEHDYEEESVMTARSVVVKWQPVVLF
jgi:hypothetical protein